MNVHNSSNHKTPKQSSCPSAGDGLNALCYAYTMEQKEWTTQQWKEWAHTTWINLQGIMLSEKKKQILKAAHCRIPLTWHFWNDKIFKMENRLAVAGVLGMEWGWEGGEYGYKILKVLGLLGIIRYTIVLHNVDNWRKVSKSTHSTSSSIYIY